MEAFVTVFDSPHYKGFDGEDEELYRLSFGKILPLSQALQHRWNTDAHMALYSVNNENQLPRLNKTALRWFQSKSMSFMPQMDVVAVDIDLPGHGDTYSWHNVADWPAPLQQFYAQLTSATRTVPELQTAGTYLTRGGLRFIWPLAPGRRIGVSLGDSYLKQFNRYLQEQGVPGVDGSCTQWNRLFRLPYVVREGSALNLPMDLSSMNYLNWAPPLGLSDESPSALGEAARTDMPEVVGLQLPGRGEYQRLRKSPQYTVLSTGQAIASAGSRHDTVMTAVAFIVAEFDTNDPLVPFRYLMRSCQAADYPEDELWGQCVWVCRVHDGGQKQKEKFYEDVIHESALAMSVTAPQVRKQLILATRTNSNFYVWDEVNKHWKRPISGTSLLLSELRRHSPTLFRLPSNTPDKQILENHATVVDHIVISYMREKVHYDSVMNTVYEPGAPIDPRIRPQYNADIDAWLRLLFATELDRCLDWLATLTRLDRPTCALYIKGEPNVGKGIFAQGIARLWGSAPSKYEELIRNFQDGLSQCPLIWADEKVPEDPFRKNDSSVFRKIIGTGRQKIFLKNKPPADLEGFPRILITANNPDALNIRDSLDAADIKALQQRVGYVEADDSPGRLLKERAHAAGMPVQDFVAPWIEGGGLGAHILWLRDTRHVVPGDRFLVEGWPSNFTSRMSIRFGLAPVVGKFVVKVIRDKHKQVRGVVWGDGKIFVNVDYIRDAWQTVMGRSSRPPGDQTLMKALRVLSDGERERMRPRAGDNVRFFWSIDVNKVAQIAEEFHLTDAETIYTSVAAPRDVEQQPEQPNKVQGLFSLIGSTQ